MWKNSGSRLLRTFFLICCLSFPTTVCITSLKRQMESSRSWLDCWQGGGQEDVSNSRSLSQGVSVADVSGDALESGSAHGSSGPDLQPWLNGPRHTKGHARGFHQAVPVPAPRHSPPATPAAPVQSSPGMAGGGDRAGPRQCLRGTHRHLSLSPSPQHLGRSSGPPWHCSRGSPRRSESGSRLAGALHRG